MKKLMLWAGQKAFHLMRRILGGTLIDQRTGEKVPDILIIPWKGRLRVIGLNGAPLKVQFKAQTRETYWCQDLEFSTHEPPDFTNVRNRHHSDFP